MDTELIEGEEIFTDTVRYRTVGDMSCTGGVRLPGRDTRGSRPRDRRHHGSPSAVRRGPMTASQRPPWRIARRPGTSSATQRTGFRGRARRAARRCAVKLRFRAVSDDTRSAAVHDGRIGGRRQEHADRPAAVRLQAGVRGSARGRSRQASERRTAARATLDLALLTDGLRAEREQGITIDVAYRYFATRRRRTVGAEGGSSSPTAPGTSSTRGTWSRAPRRPISRSCWSTPARACSSSPSATRSSAPLLRDPAPGGGGQQDGPGRVLPGSASRTS